MKAFGKAIPAILALFLVSCGSIPFAYKTSEKTAPGAQIPYPDAGFFVVSDLHLCRFPEGSGDRVPEKFSKLLVDSEELLAEVEAIIGSAKADFVIVPGDLTEYGEYSNHQGVAEVLARIEKTGKQVFVIPGNHDVLNYNVVHSPTSGSERSVTPSEFETVFADFGFDEAISLDRSSLSYVAEPVPGLWLLALDSCRYGEQTRDNPSVTGGRIGRATLEWMESVLIRAKTENKAVMAMMHHNLVEHFNGQKKYFAEYVVEDNEEIAGLFAHYGVRLVFTGHYHAQDIAIRRTGGSYTIDVETGSLASYPCPLRSVTMDAQSQNAVIGSLRIGSTKSHPAGFQAYAREQMRNVLVTNAESILKRFGMSAAEARALSLETADGYLSHADGDENPDASTWDPSVAGCFYGCLIGAFISDLGANIWRDSPPPDNDVVIDLKTGDFR